MKLAEELLEVAGVWGWVALGALVVCVLATSSALWGKETSRPATVLSVAAATIAGLSVLVPILATRQRLLLALDPETYPMVAYEAFHEHVHALLGGGLVTLTALLLATMATIRRGPDAGRTIALLLLTPAVAPAALAVRLGWDFIHDRDAIWTMVESPNEGTHVVAALIAVAVGALLMGVRAHAQGRPLSVPARVLACVLAVSGPLAFLAARPLAHDAGHPLPQSDQWIGYYQRVEDLPVVDTCDVSFINASMLGVDDDDGVSLDARQMDLETVRRDLETLRRNHSLLHPHRAEETLSLAVHVPAERDPRALAPFLRMVRDESTYEPFLVARRRRPVQTATVGEVEQNDICNLALDLSPDGAPDDRSIPLARVTDGQTLARLLSTGGRSLDLGEER